MMEAEQTRTEQAQAQEQEQEQTSGEALGNQDAGEEKQDLSWHLDRIWQEIKDATRQLESETRRGGQIAKLKLEMLGLRRKATEHTARLGHLVYEAQKTSDKQPTLARVEGYDELVAEIAALEAEIEAKQEEIAKLKAQPQEQESSLA